MKIFRKIAAIFTAAAIAVAAAAATVVTAGADSIYDTAKAISSGESVSTNIWRVDEADYKITSNRNGTLRLSIEAQFQYFEICVYDSDGNLIETSDTSSTSGTIDKPGYEICGAKWNSTIEKFKGTASYSIKKGTYYIRFSRHSLTGDYGKLTFTATFPGATESTAKINYLTINLKKGDTLSLGASVSGSGTVKWSSSKPTVAAVSSSGKVTAKKAGSAIITAKCGSSSQKIKIVVS